MTEVYNAAGRTWRRSGDLPRASGQCGELKHNKKLIEGGWQRRLEAGLAGADERGEELPAAVWGGAGAGGLRLDDGADYGWFGNSAKPRAARAKGRREPRRSVLLARLQLQPRRTALTGQ